MNRWVIIAIVSTLLGACGGDHATPRRHAYPRVQTADTTYTTVQVAGTPLSIDINSEAEVSTRKGGDVDGIWVDARYPTYRGATTYYTFTPVPTQAKLEEVVDNRLERIHLNTGGATTEITEFLTPQGYMCRVFVTPTALVTPVQFLATPTELSPRSYVVSGVFNIEGATSADSVAPIVDAVSADIIR